MDYMSLHRPRPNALADVVEAFANAPNLNPDGSTGIDLLVQLDEEVPEQENVATWSGFDAIRNTRFGTSSERDR